MSTNPWKELGPGPDPPLEINVVVEIPRGSRNKYEYDKASGFFRLDRVLYSAVHYPGDYGFIPRTLAGDGDPLDALVMVTVPTFTGCLLVARPVGLFRMSDEKGVDEKILSVPVGDPLYDAFHGLGDVAPHFLREVAHFFAIYKDLEGVATEVGGWEGLDSALESIRSAIDRYEQEVE